MARLAGAALRPAPSGAAIATLTATDWDVVCIGSGLTSLAYAAMLVQRDPGMKLLVIERHNLAGGYATHFMRPRHHARFECSLHKLSGMREPGHLIRILRQLGLDRMLSFIHPASYISVSFGDEVVNLPNDPAGVLRVLGERFPEDREGLASLFGEIEVHGRNSYFQYQIMSGTFEGDLTEMIRQIRHAHRVLRPLRVDEGLARLIRSPRLREVLTMPGLYLGGYPHELGYLYYLHVLYAILYCGNAFVKGGAQALSDALVDRIEAGGGTVLLRTSAERIPLDAAGRACAVETSRGTFSAREVVINAAPQQALDTLFDPVPQLAAARRKVAELQPSWSVSTVYLVIDGVPAALGLTQTDLFLVEELDAQARAARDAALASGDAARIEQACWQLSPCEITNYALLDPSGGPVVICNVLDRIDHWPARGTAEYKAKKQRLAQTMMARLFRRCPALASRVRYSEVSSPRTYERYTLNPAGAGFGALVAGASGQHSFHHNFPVDNVQFMSTWVSGVSYESAFAYAEHRAAQWRPPVWAHFACSGRFQKG